MGLFHCQTTSENSGPPQQAAMYLLSEEKAMQIKGTSLILLGLSRVANFFLVEVLYIEI